MSEPRTNEDVSYARMSIMSLAMTTGIWKLDQMRQILTVSNAKYSRLVAFGWPGSHFWPFLCLENIQTTSTCTYSVSDKKKNNIQPNAFLRNDSIPSSSPTVSTLRYTTQFFSSTSHFSLHPFVLHPPSCTLSLGVENPLITTWNLPPHPFSQEEFLTPLQLLSALPQLYSST